MDRPTPLLTTIRVTPTLIDATCGDSDVPGRAYTNRRNLDAVHAPVGPREASKVKVTDITNTVNCFFAKTIRRRLKEFKIDKLKVVFSSEIQDETSLKMTDGSNFKKSFYGTNSYMP